MTIGQSGVQVAVKGSSEDSRSSEKLFAGRAESEYMRELVVQ